VPQFCRDVLIENLTIYSPDNSPNTDGIDPANSRDLLIRGCTIDTGDDDVALKAGGSIPCENITVEDCTIKHGHGISIGSETSSGVNNFLVQNCTFENTVTALRIKSARQRGGKIQNVTYRNITMKSVETAIGVSFYYDDRDEIKHPEFKPLTARTPRLSKVRFENITCEDAAHAGEIAGLPEAPATEVVLKNVHITAGVGMLIQDVSGIEMRDFTVTTSRHLEKRAPEAKTAALPDSAPKPSASPAVNSQ
jgi:polygalacturonase